MKTIFKADNVPIEWEQVDVSGVETGDKHSEELFRESIASLKRNKIGLKGMVTPAELKMVLTNPRDPAYSSRTLRPPIFQRRLTSRARYLRFNCADQEYPGLQDSP